MCLTQILALNGYLTRGWKPKDALVSARNTRGGGSNPYTEEPGGGAHAPSTPGSVPVTPL